MCYLQDLTPLCATGTLFRVTPRIESKELTVDEPMVFVVANNRMLPKAQLAGENSESMTLNIDVEGDTFRLTVRASKVVPAAAPTLLLITGHTGRTIRVALTAKAKPRG